MQKILSFPVSFLKRAAVAASAALLAAPVAAQSLFSPALTVNGDPITHYQLEQRARLLQILRAPGDPKKLAREGLIEDRLKQQAFDQVDFAATEEEVANGIEEFAGRANMTGDQLFDAVSQAGVAPETITEFIRTTITWRDYIQGRFLNRARPSDSEIDRAIGQGTKGGIQILLSEIIIPITPQTIDQVGAVAEDITKITDYGAFSAAAAKYSASPSRQNGGRLEWLSLSKLPPPLQGVVMELKPGQVTDPINLPNAVALFQMRGIREAESGAQSYSAIDYATYYIPGGRSAEARAIAADVQSRIDTCDDLYGIAKGQAPERLERHTKEPSAIPRDIAIELAKLDPNEISTTLTNGQNLVFLMLCGRTSKAAENASREDVANALTNQRLIAFAKGYLDQLKADALIVDK